jgi:hypothetical protein
MNLVGEEQAEMTIDEAVEERLSLRLRPTIPDPPQNAIDSHSITGGPRIKVGRSGGASCPFPHDGSGMNRVGEAGDISIGEQVPARASS